MAGRPAPRPRTGQAGAAQSFQGVQDGAQVGNGRCGEQRWRGGPSSASGPSMSRHREGSPASRFPAACSIAEATTRAAPAAPRPARSRHLPSLSRVIAPCRASAEMTSVTVNGVRPARLTIASASSWSLNRSLMTWAGSGPSVILVSWESRQSECLGGVEAMVSVWPVCGRQADAVQTAQQQAQQGEAGRVGPVQVVGHDQAARLCHGRDEADCGLHCERAAFAIIQAAEGGVRGARPGRAPPRRARWPLVPPAVPVPAAAWRPG